MVTCNRCRATYRDDNDWSGPSHSERDCVRELRAKCDKIISLLQQIATHTTCSRRACADAEHWVQLSDAAKHLLIELGEA